jgi:hypothetical protein
MDDTVTPDLAPALWLDALAESGADIGVGRIVPGEVVMRDLRESLARLEAQTAAGKTARKGMRRR